MAKVQRVVFQPSTYQGMQRGINKMVGVVRPTLGPMPRIVAMDRMAGEKMPEMLDDGGVIARRIIQLPDRDEDMGAMFVRHVLWSLHEKVGDGTATAAVILESIYNQGVRYIIAGGNAMQLRRYLERGLEVVNGELTRMAIRLEGEEHLAQIAESICYDPPLAKMLGEIFNIIGEYGRIEIRSGRSRELEREYVEGMYWHGGAHSRLMIEGKPNFRADLEDAAILISDFDIEDPRKLMPVLRGAMEARLPALVVIAAKLSEPVLHLLMAANKYPDKFQVIAAKTPGAGNRHDQIGAMEDLAVLTGGRFFSKVAGSEPTSVKVEDLGRVRKAWVDRTYLGVIGGKGDPRALREHIAALRAAFQKADEAEVRKRLQERIGKLMGGAATLWVGDVTEMEIEKRKEAAKRTAEAVRCAILDGVLPGGGVALLACRPALRRLLDQSTDPDEQAAYRILIRALEEPTRTILANAGYDVSEVMAEIRRAGEEHGFDVRTGQIVDAVEAGIFDVASVLREAVCSGVASAALALTVDVLVHHKTQRFERDIAAGKTG